MHTYSEHHQISLPIDAALVDWVDELVSRELDPQQDLSQEAIEQKRLQAIEDAIRAWCQQQTQRRLQQSAELHRQRHDNDETGWLV